MTKPGKQELLLEVRPRYLRAGRAEKGRILDEFVAATRYHRKYAIHLLVNSPPAHSHAARRGRTPYGPAVVCALLRISQSCDCICSKRLKPFLPTMIQALERSGELVLVSPIKSSLLAMSAATIERKLQPARRRLKRRGLTTTRAGPLLKRQIPVRTFADWQDTRPGFTEVDLVGRCDDSTRGEYLNSVAMVDVATGWFECGAVTYRSQRDVFAALQTMRASLPLPLLGIDSDNTVPSSTPTGSTVASRSTSPSPAPDPTRKATKPPSSRRTVPSSAVWSAMTAIKARQLPWSSTPPTTCSAWESTSSNLP